MDQSSDVAFLITSILGLVGLVGPPLLSTRGRGYRGLWAALIFVTGLIGFFMFMVSPGENDPAYQALSKPQIKVVSDILGAIGLGLFGTAFGCFLATLMYRKRVQVKS